MGWRPLGDCAWLFETDGPDMATAPGRTLALYDLLEARRIPLVRDIVAAFDSLAVHFDPADGHAALEWIKQTTPPLEPRPSLAGRTVEIPVRYGGLDGPDLAHVAASLGLTTDEVITRHSEARYEVAAIGFSPGFPYLSGLDPRLHMPRKATPCPVAAGAVAIAGDQAGIYPTASQGGWQVLGRCQTNLFDPARLPAALLQTGDHVRFVPAKDHHAPTPASCHEECPAAGDIEVLDPGAFASVQDLGRPGFRASGVSAGGALDAVAARVANRLVGNPEDAALLECALGGPVLRFSTAAVVAWTGGPHPMAGRPIHIHPGEVLDLRGRMHTAVSYLAIAGGIDTPVVLGSRSTDIRAGFGGHHGRTLRKGDMLVLGTPCGNPPPSGDWRVGWPWSIDPRRPLELRFLRGMQSRWFSPDSLKTFSSAWFRTNSTSDRTGTRLDGPPLTLEDQRSMTSQPVVPGSVQVPPDGRPIVLLAECQTIGGYPQIGHVISADLPALARALPGTAIRFREVTLDEARSAWRDLRHELDLLHTGLRLLPS
jgi:KipI family sensor histidine kinase inhibitor